MNSILGNGITNNMHSEVTVMILYSNVHVFQIKYLNTVISCPKGMENYLVDGVFESKQSDYLPQSW